MAERTTNIHLRTTEEIKRMAEERAEEEGRTLTNYIEYLIKKDCKSNKQ